jgi:hypothetical protein
MKSMSATCAVAAVIVLAIAGCKKTSPGSPDASQEADAAVPDAPVIDASVADASVPDATVDARPDAHLYDARPDAMLDPILLGIYHEVDAARLVQTLRELTGTVPVTVGGVEITIDERYSDAGRKKFRDYWSQQMKGLGLDVHVQDFDGTGHPRAGTNLEAVLPGASPDSFVIIVHYDSIGPAGMETMNPGVDDDMTGMAIELEAARILVAHKATLQHTVRFVATDEEELGGLSGAREYAKYLQAKATTDGFALIGAVDNEQTGWNCHADGLCGAGTQKWPVVDIFSCDGNQYDYKAYGDDFAQIVRDYSPLTVVRHCMGENSDHYAMWEIGVPTLVYSEHNPFANPHFDQNGGDSFDKIDQDYFVTIARPAITFQAKVVGLEP